MATLLQAGPADHGDLRKNRHAAFRLRAAAPLDQKEKAPAAGWRLFFLRECSVWIPGFHWEATPGRGGDNLPQRRQIKAASLSTGCFYLPLPCKIDICSKALGVNDYAFKLMHLILNIMRNYCQEKYA